ncbi:TetR/AcrR family transcriptional regulator [Myroides marinus]|uniref:TetR/AcrR family transcriptional regulator n=1 Tax=Myroides marinus TaxID=703342 RepID=UPI0025791C3C|nr:TetR/AcrR family transcriptional regulator [Myroides marinus]MDM1379346.1 TetR/AcrR family transcriptional regulator [Myroides marinus]MDM1386712.1 TetR/AcrR family transcriptional regulator [Myroides marinus]MDM1393925.1 TetR/AcrR family transcriptional regulator [Myroides marinus]MDM1531748.1 TetR/AcrR family transcriptional regulator [Myroides marinus]MDM1538828.1 TetR/AcrR family transcriptional regulator [Myroides marinus]
MTEKTGKTRERNKEKSKEELLQAVGTILKEKGYPALKVNDIAATAGLDKKLIYNYFGGTEQLLDEYINSQYFWNNIEPNKVLEVASNDGGKEMGKQLLAEQYDFVQKNKEFQKLMLWQLSEDRDSLRNIVEKQEEVGEVLFKNVSDIHFGDKATDYRALMAILVSGAYYLNLYAEHNGRHFCGIDLHSEEGRQQIKDAMNAAIDKIYEK